MPCLAAGGWLSGKIFADTAFQKILQLPVHIFIVVIDIKADHPLACQDVRILFLYSPHMLFLHAKDNVCPPEKPGCHLDAGVLLGSRGTRPVPVIAVEKLFGGQAAALVLAA